MLKRKLRACWCYPPMARSCLSCPQPAQWVCSKPNVVFRCGRLWSNPKGSLIRWNGVMIWNRIFRSCGFYLRNFFSSSGLQHQFPDETTDMSNPCYGWSVRWSYNSNQDRDRDPCNNNGQHIWAKGDDTLFSFERIPNKMAPNRPLTPPEAPMTGMVE